jgi:hypothetical protein
MKVINMKQYTAIELIKKYSGKYIDVYPTYDYKKQQWLYEVRGVSKIIRENYNLPEDCIVKN